MKLYEHQGKALFKQAKIPIPKGALITKPKQLQGILKAQVLEGGRGKAGLIKKTTKEKSKKHIAKLLKKCKTILAEEILPIKQEHYLSAMVDRDACTIKIIYSPKGGIDIEEVAKKTPDEVKYYTNPDNVPKRFKPMAIKLFDLLKKKDLLLAEINPLIETTNGKLIAADAKVIVDDNALSRQPEFLKEYSSRLSKEEKQANKHDIHFVKLKGNIAVIGNGAGLVMTTLDLLSQKKLKPADFLDVKGGANEKSMRGALELVHKAKPKALFINIFGGITHCDAIAKAIAKWKLKNKTKIPIVVRMIGTNEKEAEQILSKANITPVHSLEKGIQTLRRAL
ncbi:MAG: ATP-grasp domain-containing protein [Candidatus Nanoarchaeia archaeon]